MALPNPGMSFTPFDTLPASDLNDMVENIEALAAGTGQNAASVNATKIDFGGAGSGVWWEEIGRTTLSGAADVITVSGIPTRKYLMVVSNLYPSGSISSSLRFNNDSANNYSARDSGNGGADTTRTSQSSISVGASNSEMFTQHFIRNVSNKEKVVDYRTTFITAAGAATVPERQEGAGKWANTSTQITRIDFVNTQSGDYAAGSEVIVLGHN
jgi:hypothetical protein